MSTQRAGDRRYGGLSAEQRTTQRRQKFIATGIEIIGSHGFKAATVRKLCSEAGLTARYFYESFEDTEALLIEAFDQCMDEITGHVSTAVEAAGGGENPDSVLEAVLHAFFIEMEDRRVARLLMLEVLGISDTVDEITNQKMSALGNLIIGLLRAMSDEWPIDEQRGTLLGVAVLGAMRQATIHWMVHDYKPERQAVVETTSFLVKGLLLAIEREVRDA